MNPPPIDTGCCLLWTGSTATGMNPHQHRAIDADTGRNAARVAMEAKLGRPLGREELVLHMCDEYLCVRLEHLYVGTSRQNTDDRFKRGRSKPICTPFCRLTAEQRHSQLWTTAVDRARHDVSDALIGAGET